MELMSQHIPLSAPLAWSDWRTMAQTYRAHPLHTQDRHWPQTSCYVDLWIEILHTQGLEPCAALGFSAAQDFEGDQFTFTKISAEDIEVLYGLAVQELSIYTDLHTHLLTQQRQGRLTLVEVDGWFLPDTRGLTYRNEHGKTTIGVRHLDPASRGMAYFHNSGFYVLEGEDYEGIFASGVTQACLPPYVEFVTQRSEALTGPDLARAAHARLRTHLKRRPARNPVTAYRNVFLAQLQNLFTAPQAAFHHYAFNVVRQLGCNWELMGSHLHWLTQQGHVSPPDLIAACQKMAQDAKTLQFRMARLAARRTADPCTAIFDDLESGYETIISGLSTHFS